MHEDIPLFQDEFIQRATLCVILPLGLHNNLCNRGNYSITILFLSYNASIFYIRQIINVVETYGHCGFLLDVFSDLSFSIDEDTHRGLQQQGLNHQVINVKGHILFSDQQAQLVPFLIKQLLGF